MRVSIESGPHAREVDLWASLTADDEEQAHEEAYRWIKAVRVMRVDDAPLRSRFTFRGDSLWWFAELYLHKDQAILHALRTLRALERLFGSERIDGLRFVAGRHPGLIGAAAAARGVRYSGPSWRSSTAVQLATDAASRRLAAAARLSRLRPALGRPARGVPAAAFVHRAFWRAGRGDGSAESYIGPALQALEARLGGGAVAYVGVGPRTNFRARRWWTPLSGHDAGAVVPIERYAPAAAMAESRALYRDRQRIRAALWASRDLRVHAVLRGVDCWPLVRDQLAGIALLQFPWSARAMDEAAAALEALRPEVAVTYAEAGGWGRAIALEARRRGVPLAGLQHGFIYRHWLNYRHEPDEMAPDPANSRDAGFPRPARTLLFDEQAAAHLRQAGRFPPASLAVTGSAPCDQLRAAVAALGPADLERVRRDAGAAPEQALVVLVAKEREARGALPALIEAVRAMPAVQLAIKPHPAETPEVYAWASAGAVNVRVLAAEAPLPPLLGAARALVTVNSTVAIDAVALGVPSLVIGLPNNLSPFVDAGVMAGAGSADEIRERLSRLLYDQMFRSSLARGPIAGGGAAAAAAADAILALRS